MNCPRCGKKLRVLRGWVQVDDARARVLYCPSVFPPFIWITWVTCRLQFPSLGPEIYTKHLMVQETMWDSL